MNGIHYFFAKNTCLLVTMVLCKMFKYFDTRDHLCVKKMFAGGFPITLFVRIEIYTVSNKCKFTIKMDKHVKFCVVGISIHCVYIYDSNSKQIT